MVGQPWGALGIFHTDERDAIVLNGHKASDPLYQGLFQSLLQRDADPMGYQFYLAQLQRGVSLLDIRLQFVTSAEFFHTLQ